MPKTSKRTHLPNWQVTSFKTPIPSLNSPDIGLTILSRITSSIVKDRFQQTKPSHLTLHYSASTAIVLLCNF